MKFFKNNVSVSECTAPEEMLPSVSGSCGCWQILVCFIAFIAALIHGIDVTSVKTSTPFQVNYTCANSDNRCFYSNGTKCETFKFPAKQVVTFTQKVSKTIDW